MARKKQPKTPFYTEGMTVKEILNISPDKLVRLNKRDISRALRTVALAANKRVSRLKKYATKTKEGYIPKKTGKYQIATMALNWVTHDGKDRAKFGVRKSATRNQMLKQFSTIRQFMSMKTSTVSGAVKVRKEMEKRIFGKTREQAARGKKGRSRAQIMAQYESRSSDVWAAFRKFLELKGRDPHSYISGSEAIIELIGNKIISGASEAEAIDAALKMFQDEYEQEQEEYNNIFNDSDFWET
mgnify:CR=1 FL=1